MLHRYDVDNPFESLITSVMANHGRYCDDGCMHDCVGSLKSTSMIALNY